MLSRWRWTQQWESECRHENHAMSSLISERVLSSWHDGRLFLCEPCEDIDRAVTCTSHMCGSEWQVKSRIKKLPVASQNSRQARRFLFFFKNKFYQEWVYFNGVSRNDGASEDSCPVSSVTANLISSQDAGVKLKLFINMEESDIHCNDCRVSPTYTFSFDSWCIATCFSKKNKTWKLTAVSNAVDVSSFT